MALPAFLKSPYVIGSAGVVGVGGISAASLSGGGSGEDYSENIRQNTGLRKNLVSNLLTSNNLETKCFSEFFGSDTGVVFSDAASPDVNVVASQPSDDSSDRGTLKGCTHIQFSSKNKEAFVFQTETTVRDNKFGLALGSFGTSIGYGDLYSGSKLSPKLGNIIRYYLVFLEKGEGSWEVKGGYSWMDRKFANGLNGVTLHLKSPSGNINVNDKWSGVASGTEYVYKDDEWKHEMYLGLGDGSDSGKEVFGDVELGGDSKEDAEILGRDYTKTFEATKSGRGYGDEGLALKKYVYKNSTGHSCQKLDVGILDKWYAPFKGKLGTWKETPNLNLSS